MVGKVAAFCFGLFAYSAFLVTILYAIGFTGGFGVPKTIDDGPKGRVGQAIAIDVLLLFLFALQHTVMARPAFKRQWTKIVPKPIERSTFVLVASLLLGLIFWQWRPITSVVWDVENAFGRAIVYGLFFLGWLLVFYSSFLIDHFDLFGMRQVVLHLRGKQYTHPPFKTVSLYKLVRHPLMLGFLIAFWSTPTMTHGHLLFAAVITAYIFFGITMEERDLKKFLGEEYHVYRQQTPILLPLRLRRSRHDRQQNASAAANG